MIEGKEHKNKTNNTRVYVNSPLTFSILRSHGIFVCFCPAGKQVKKFNHILSPLIFPKYNNLLVKFFKSAIY